MNELVKDAKEPRLHFEVDVQGFGGFALSSYFINVVID